MDSKSLHSTQYVYITFNELYEDRYKKLSQPQFERATELVWEQSFFASKTCNNKPRRNYKAEKNLKTKLTEFEHIPVEDIVVGEPLSMEEGAEQLPEVAVVGPLFETEPPAVLQVQLELNGMVLEKKLFIWVSLLVDNWHFFLILW